MNSKAMEALEESIIRYRYLKRITLVTPFIITFLIFGVSRVGIFMPGLGMEDFLKIGVILMVFCIYIYYDYHKKMKALENPQLVEFVGVITKRKMGRNVKYYDDKTDTQYFGGSIDLDEFHGKAIKGLVEDNSKIFVTIEELKKEGVL